MAQTPTSDSADTAADINLTDAELSAPMTAPIMPIGDAPDQPADVDVDGPLADADINLTDEELSAPMTAPIMPIGEAPHDPVRD